MYYFIVNPSAGSGSGMKKWKMIAALLDGQPIECEYGEGITPEEQEQIKSLNDAIWKKVHPEGENGEMSLFN